jgi:hypothetical protein
MTGFNSKRQAAQDKVNDEPDTLLISYQSGFADGKRSAQRKPLTEEKIGFECRKHFWMHGTRFEDAYKVGFRDSEAAHNIKE